jgi:hypothetical protein
MGSSESVGAGQHPHLVAQQAAVGRIVNVGLDHSGVDAHPPEFGEALHLGALNVKIPGIPVPSGCPEIHVPWMFGRGSTVPIEVEALPLISNKELPEGGEIHEHRPKAARL